MNMRFYATFIMLLMCFIVLSSTALAGDSTDLNGNNVSTNSGGISVHYVGKFKNPCAGKHKIVSGMCRYGPMLFLLLTQEADGKL